MIYEFMATQDLHGWEKPWAPGAGKNKMYRKDSVLPKTDSGITFSAYDTDGVQLTGKATATTGWNCFVVDIEDGEEYTISTRTPFVAQSGMYINLPSYLNNVSKGNIGTGISPGHPSVTFTASEIDMVEGRVTINSGIEPNGKIIEMQCEKGDTATDWEPYANVCMPEGYNIWNPHNDEFMPVYAGYVNANTRELYLRPVYEEYAGEELVGPWMSSWDPYEEDTTPTEGAFVIDFGGELTSFEITPFMLQTLLDSLGIRQHFTDGAGLLNSLMDQAQGRVRSEEELLHLSRPLNVIAIGDQLPAGLTFKPISKDVLPGLPGKFIR